MVSDAHPRPSRHSLIAAQLLRTNPSWFKPLALKRRGEDAERAADQVANFILSAIGGEDA